MCGEAKTIDEHVRVFLTILSQPPRFIKMYHHTYPYQPRLFLPFSLSSPCPPIPTASLFTHGPCSAHDSVWRHLTEKKKKNMCEDEDARSEMRDEERGGGTVGARQEMDVINMYM